MATAAAIKRKGPETESGGRRVPWAKTGGFVGIPRQFYDLMPQLSGNAEIGIILSIAMNTVDGEPGDIWCEPLTVAKFARACGVEHQGISTALTRLAGWKLIEPEETERKARGGARAVRYRLLLQSWAKFRRPELPKPTPIAKADPEPQDDEESPAPLPPAVRLTVLPGKRSKIQFEQQVSDVTYENATSFPLSIERNGKPNSFVIREDSSIENKGTYHQSTQLQLPSKPSSSSFPQQKRPADRPDSKAHGGAPSKPHTNSPPDFSAQKLIRLLEEQGVKLGTGGQAYAEKIVEALQHRNLPVESFVRTIVQPRIEKGRNGGSPFKPAFLLGMAREDDPVPGDGNGTAGLSPAERFARDQEERRRRRATENQ